MDVIETIDSTTKKLLASPLFAGYAVLSDFVFFLLYGFTMSLLLDPTSLALSRVISAEQATVTELVTTGILLPAIGWLLLTFVSIYLLFCILEGSAFYWTHRILGRNLTYPVFLKRMLSASLPWFIIFVGYELLAFVRDYIAQTQPLPSIVGYLFTVLVLLILYVAGVHLALIGQHNISWSKAVTYTLRHTKTLSSHLVIVLPLAFLVDFILRSIPGTSVPLVILRSLFFLLWILWTRTFWLGIL